MKVNQLCVVAAAFMALSACGSPDGGLRGGIPPAPDPAPVDGIQLLSVPTNNRIANVRAILRALG